MLRTLVVVLALAVVAFAQSSGSFTNTFYLSGGVPFCTQCGAQGQYACSSGGVGNWQSNFMVRDPVAPGSAVSGIEVALIGSFACTWTPSVLAVTINGVPVNTLQSGGSNACQCNTCDGSLVYSITFPSFNLPYYSYGGSNNITINVLSGSVCLNAVNITTSWAPPPLQGTQGALARTDISRYTDFKVCNSIGYDTSSSISFSFDDPLPAGSLLLQANVQLFGSYWCYTTSSVAPSITATLDGTQVGSVRLPARTRSASCSWGVQCDGSFWTSPSGLYQNGWPGYSYGGRNTLTLATSYYPRLGGVSLFLTYYQNGKVQNVSIVPDHE